MPHADPAGRFAEQGRPIDGGFGVFDSVEFSVQTEY
jgi:hypothetical protein